MRLKIMFKTKINNPKPSWMPYFAIYLFLLALSGCAQLFSADSKTMDKDDHEAWLGATCAVVKMTNDTLETGNEQFQVCQPETWGAAKKVVGIKHLYITSQPDSETFDIAREKGIELVINLRDHREVTWDEKKAVNQAGLNYYNLPISASGESFDPDIINQISELVQQHKDKKILMHCSSGNRASAWLAIHMANDHNMQSDAAISLAKKVGLTSPVITQRILRYLQGSVEN